jgi:hypothetical protein
MRSHKDQTYQTLVAGIFHSMKLIREGTCDFPRPEPARFLPDGEGAFPFHDVVDLVVPLMAMDFLQLARFQAIDVAKHPRTLKEIHLLHFLGTELNRFGDRSYLHKQDCILNR